MPQIPVTILRSGDNGWHFGAIFQGYSTGANYAIIIMHIHHWL